MRRKLGWNFLYIFLRRRSEHGNKEVETMTLNVLRNFLKVRGNIVVASGRAVLTFASWALVFHFSSSNILSVGGVGG